MIVYVIEELKYKVELPDDTIDPELTAEDAIVNAIDRDDRYTPVVLRRESYISRGAA